MITKKIIVSGFIGLILLIISCSENTQVTTVDLSRKEDIKTSREQHREDSIRIAVGGMITPREGFMYYRKLLDYIDEKLDLDVEFVDREDYSEINELLHAEKIDVAFVCGGPYVDGHEKFGMELMAAPYAYGGTVYYSYIIAHKDSQVETFEDLRGRTFAFTDPISNSGKLAPTYMLARMNETPESFFEKINYTYAHDKSIRAVAEGLVDGAAVDSLIWEYASRTDPELTSRIRIIKKSLPYGIPPVVVRKGLDEEVKDKLKYLFLNIHKDEQGRDILRGMMVERFVHVEDSEYDSIREMKEWISRYKEGATGAE